MMAAPSAPRRAMSDGKHRKRLKLSLGDRNDAIVDLTLSDEDGESEASGAPESKKSQRVPAGESAPIVLPDSDEDAEDAIKFVSHKERPKPKSINEILKDSSGAAPGSTPPRPVAALPPLLLTRPEQVAQHTPCSLHFGILPAALAERLYRVMLAESKAWERNRWYLADRHVESPHTTAFYSTDPEADSVHWYMGRKDHKEIPNGFLPEMEEARQIIEAFVNTHLGERQRYGLEYDGPWRANVAAANCYKGRAETVGAHADQLTYLGPYPTIASLSLGVTRNFRLRGVPSVQANTASSEPPIRTYDVVLPHNSLCIMGAGTQERFKHSIPPARSIDLFKLKNRETGETETFIERINMTFRFYRPDFKPASTPVCSCGIPCVLRADAKGKAAAAVVASSSVSTISGAGAAGTIACSESQMRFFWQCTAGAQNEGKSCNYFRFLDMEKEGRGPCLHDAIKS